MNPGKLGAIGITISVLIVGSLSERILFLLPLASRSHVHVFEPLMRALGEKGHDIVALSPIESKNMPKTVKQIPLITVEDLVGNMPNLFDQRKQGMLALLMNSSSFDHMNKACLKALKSPNLHDIRNEKFDLIIVDIILNYCVLGLIPHFKAPSIYVSTGAVPSSIAIVVGNRLPQSFVPSIFLQYSDKMTFKERMINSVSDTLSSFLWDIFIVKQAESMYREHLPNGKELPSVSDIQKNVSMLFTNSHFSINYPRPLLPDVIEVGGMHTRPAKPLQKDLDDFLNGSGDDGFIFFSLGSVVKPGEMPESTRKVFLNVFSKLKQRVLWKWATDNMPDAPPNVLLRKWLPQQDILGHPKIKLFMSHGGLLSTQESVYHGVPVLGLPIAGDQDLNVKQAEAAGYAKFVEIVDLSEETLEHAIMELIGNPKYSQKVKALSKIVKDLPETPLDKAIFWTEYVLRHKGAPHLRSAARDLNFFQYYVLDVTAVILGIVALLLYLLLGCCKSMWRRAIGRKGRRHFKRE